MGGRLDPSLMSDAELEFFASVLEKRTSYEAFCFDGELFGDEIPAMLHRVICTCAQMIADGDLDRLMLFAPPCVAKSTYISKRFIAWLVGYRPGIRIITASHTASLAHKHGRESRNLVASPAYRAIFPEVSLTADLQARHDWATTEGSEVFACGFDGGVTGRRADVIIVDDPFKGRKEADSEVIRDSTWETYKSDIRSRMRKDAAIIMMHQRWHEDDVAGRIMPADWDGRSGWHTARDGEQWYVVNLQMIAEFDDDLLGRKAGDLLWPEWFDAKRVEQDRISAGSRDWNAKYQGRPSSEEGAIIKAAWWRKWPGKAPPVVEYIVCTYDTAFEEDEEDDESARSTWGVFDIQHPANAEIIGEAMRTGRMKEWVQMEGGKDISRGEVHRYHAILLEAWHDRVEFAKLKREARDHYMLFKPDRVLIEKKASGHSLLQELRRGRNALPVKGIKADVSKRSRTYAAQPAFEQGAVWHMDRAWAQAVIRQCQQFPTGKLDDVHDTVIHSINWLRRTYHLVLKGEDEGQFYADDADEERAVEVAA